MDRSAQPSRAALARAARVAGPLATVSAAHPLAGGTHARTYLVQTVNPERELVLREFPAGDDAARREAHVLGVLDGLDGLAPRLLASDVGPASPEHPAVMISRLPGRADITPTDPRRWAAEMGRALARVHAADLERLTGFESVFERPGGSEARLTGPAAAAVTAAWERLVSAPTVLAH
jgi:Phosphotransferase enzyme family